LTLEAESFSVFLSSLKKGKKKKEEKKKDRSLLVLKSRSRRTRREREKEKRKTEEGTTLLPNPPAYGGGRRNEISIATTTPNS